MTAIPICDVTLRSSECTAVTIPAAVAWKNIGLLNRLIALDEGGCEQMPPLELDFSTEVVRAVADYLVNPDRRTTEIPKPLRAPVEHIVKSWEIEFVRSLEQRDILVQTSACSSYLQIEELHNLLAAWMAQRIDEIAKGAPTIMEASELIRQYLHMKNEWSPEEMVHLEKEMKYAKEVDPGAY